MPALGPGASNPAESEVMRQEHEFHKGPLTVMVWRGPHPLPPGYFFAKERAKAPEVFHALRPSLPLWFWLSVHLSSFLSVSVPVFLHVLCLSPSPDIWFPYRDKGCGCWGYSCTHGLPGQPRLGCSFLRVSGYSGEAGAEAEGSLCVGAAYEGGAQEGKF